MSPYRRIKCRAAWCYVTVDIIAGLLQGALHIVVSDLTRFLFLPNAFTIIGGNIITWISFLCSINLSEALLFDH